MDQLCFVPNLGEHAPHHYPPAQPVRPGRNPLHHYRLLCRHDLDDHRGADGLGAGEQPADGWTPGAELSSVRLGEAGELPSSIVDFGAVAGEASSVCCEEFAGGLGAVRGALRFRLAPSSRPALASEPLHLAAMFVRWRREGLGS